MTALLLSLLLSPAHAQEPELDGLLADRLSEMQAELDALRAADAENAAACASLEAVLANAATLLDDRRPVAERTAAASALGAGDPRALPFLRAGARDRDPEVQLASLAAAATFRDPETVDLARSVAADGSSRTEVREAAVDVLAGLGLPGAGEALWTLASAREVPGSLRSYARRALDERYPEVVATLGPPKPVSDWLGATLGVAANGVTGGVLLSSVGTWGQFEAGEVIGGTGGGLIGVGTGVLYALNEPVTLGQGLGYASGVGWGLTAGSLATTTAYGGQRYMRLPKHVDRVERSRDVGAGLRVLGVSAGAAAGVKGLRGDPRPGDVLEVDLAGLLGSQLALGVVNVATYEPPPYVWDDVRQTDNWEEVEDWQLEHSRLRAGATLGGAAAGLGAGLLLAPEWRLEPADAAFAAVVGAEAAWIGGWTGEALHDTESRGNVGTALTAGVAGALVFTELVPMSPRRTAVAGYGALVGNALGTGVPWMFFPRDDEARAWTMIGAGAAGLAGGALVEPWAQPGAGDWTMMGVGTGLAMAEAGAIGSVLVERHVIDSDRSNGLVFTTGAVAGGGLLALGHWVDPDPVDMAVLGTAGIWGTWYGVMTPYALGADLDGDDAVIVATATADAFLLAGGIALTDVVGLESRDTLVPQLGGVTGATLGALGVALVSQDGEDVALGAVIGSAVGLGGGTAVAVLLDAPTVRAPVLATAPGRWTPMLHPTVLPDGSAGVNVGLTVDGW